MSDFSISTKTAAGFLETVVLNMQFAQLTRNVHDDLIYHIKQYSWLQMWVYFQLILNHTTYTFKLTTKDQVFL